MTELYSKVLEEERAPVDYDEPLLIVGVGDNPAETHDLLENGITSSELQRRQIVRRKLLDAGFTFINKYGNGEKPLLGVPVSIQNGEKTLEVNPSSRSLLRFDELDIIKTYQKRKKDELPVGTSVDNETVRQRMLDFLVKGYEAFQGDDQAKKALFKTGLGHILENDAIKNEVKIALLDKLRGKSPLELSFFIEECIAGIDTIKVWGIPISIFPNRFNALDGRPSPFIDSGFHFSANPDLTIYPKDHSKTRRLNMMNIHLLSRDLNEMGESNNGSHDQTYITGDEFTQLPIYSGTEVSKIDTQIPLIELELIATRILARIEQ